MIDEFMLQPATKEDVRWLYRCILGREPEDDIAFRPGASFAEVRMSILFSDENRDLSVKEMALRYPRDPDLARTAHEMAIRNAPWTLGP